MKKQEVIDYLTSLEETRIEVVKTMLNDEEFDFLENISKEELWKILFLSNYCTLMGFNSYEEK